MLLLLKLAPENLSSTNIIQKANPAKQWKPDWSRQKGNALRTSRMKLICKILVKTEGACPQLLPSAEQHRCEGELGAVPHPAGIPRMEVQPCVYVLITEKLLNLEPCPQVMSLGFPKSLRKGAEGNPLACLHWGLCCPGCLVGIFGHCPAEVGSRGAAQCADRNSSCQARRDLQR